MTYVFLCEELYLIETGMFQNGTEGAVSIWDS